MRAGLGHALKLAQSAEDALPFHVIAQILRAIANDWDDAPLSVELASATREALLPPIEQVLDAVAAGSTGWPELSGLVTVFLRTDYRVT